MGWLGSTLITIVTLETILNYLSSKKGRFWNLPIWWCSSLHLKVPRFSFGMMRFIGINNVKMWRNGVGYRRKPPSPNLFLIFRAELNILDLLFIFVDKTRWFLVLSKAILKSNIVLSPKLKIGGFIKMMHQHKGSFQKRPHPPPLEHEIRWR